MQRKAAWISIGRAVLGHRIVIAAHIHPCPPEEVLHTLSTMGKRLSVVRWGFATDLHVECHSPEQPSYYPFVTYKSSSQGPSLDDWNDRIDFD